MTPDRAAYTSGLRQLADLLDERPALPLPLIGGAAHPLTVYTYERDVITEFVRHFDTLDPRPDAGFFNLVGTLDGLHVSLAVPPNLVAEKVTVDTTVTRDEWRLLPGILPTVPAAVTA